MRRMSSALGLVLLCAPATACFTTGGGGSSSGDNNGGSTSSGGSSSAQSGSNGGSSSLPGSGTSAPPQSSSGGGSSSLPGSGTSAPPQSSSGGGSSSTPGSGGDPSSSGPGTSSMMALPPDAPVVNAPVANAAVTSPLVVQGVGLAGEVAPPESIRVTLLNGTTELGTSTQVVTPGIPWVVAVAYTEPAAGTALTLNVVRINSNGTSEPTTVPLTQAGRRMLTVAVTQDGTSGTVGTTVVVQAFSVPDDVFNPAGSAELTVTDGVAAMGMVALEVPDVDAPLYVRAFRDTNGDGFAQGSDPTLEAQSATAMVGMADNMVSVELRQPDNTAARYFAMDARTENRFGSGGGLCGGGFALVVRAFGPGEMRQADLTAISAVLPDGRQGPLVQGDGQCAGETEFVRTIPEAQFPAEPGNVLIGYRNHVADFTDVRVDHLAAYVRIPLGVVPTSPTGAAAVAPGAFNVTWEAVAGANTYSASVNSTISGMPLGGYQGPATQFMSDVVPDGTPVRISIQASLEDGMGDVDAVADQGEATHVVVASAANVVTFSGAVVNESGVEGPIRVAGGGCSANQGPMGPCGQQASVVLPSNATSYTLAVLKADAPGDGWVEGYVVAPGVMIPPYKGYGDLDGTTDLTGLDMLFYKPVDITSPTNESTVGTTPTVTWADWDAAPGGEPAVWSYVLFAIAQGDDFPIAIYGLPRTQTSFTLGAPLGEAVDVLAAVMIPNGPAMSASTLPEGVAILGVGVITCGFGTPGYTACLADALSSGDNPTLASDQVMVLVSSN